MDEDLDKIEAVAKARQRAIHSMLQQEDAGCQCILELVERTRRLMKALEATGVPMEIVRAISRGESR